MSTAPSFELPERAGVVRAAANDVFGGVAVADARTAASRDTHVFDTPRAPFSEFDRAPPLRTWRARAPHVDAPGWRAPSGARWSVAYGPWPARATSGTDVYVVRIVEAHTHDCYDTYEATTDSTNVVHWSSDDGIKVVQRSDGRLASAGAALARGEDARRTRGPMPMWARGDEARRNARRRARRKEREINGGLLGYPCASRAARPTRAVARILRVCACASRRSSSCAPWHCGSTPTT